MGRQCLLQATAMSFTFTLTFDNGDEDFKGMKLSSYGMHEMVDGVAYFTLRLPKIDLYRFIIYAKDTDQEVNFVIDLCQTFDTVIKSPED